ncbi:GPR endopeptidase [Ruminococcus sp.]|uniref:GPR endopeptidase n=1 Tax=Ruminococcus sp. TaxID=41978 RepID=UPI003F0582E1
MNIRTDLALEGVDAEQIREGITRSTRGSAFSITEIRIEEDKHGAPIGKKKGRYITLEAGALSRFSDRYRDMAQELAQELRRFLPPGHVLVVGLGNSDITPDALGPQAAAHVLATRHLKTELAKEDPFLAGLRPVSVLAGGVLGQTGIESAELVAALLTRLSPAAVIAVDALACSELSRLGTTIQISDAGISPGSGVQNKRKELSAATMGIPVVAVGVPTVVDMGTIVEGLTGSLPKGQIPDMMVTPRDIDKLTERAAGLIACGINLALHPRLTMEDVESLMA